MFLFLLFLGIKFQLENFQGDGNAPQRSFSLWTIICRL